MRYLTVAADYTQPGLRDDFAGPVDPSALGLPRAICEDLQEWNAKYRMVIPLGEEDRRAVAIAALIDKLDHQGLQITERIERFFKPDVKIRYYSEGRLSYLLRQEWS